MKHKVYIATKDMTIDGKVVPKGGDLPANIDPDRLAFGLNNGRFVQRKEPAAPAPAPVVQALPEGKPAGETAVKRGGGK